MSRKKSNKKYSKYPALCKYTLRKNVREFIDFDYLDQLSEDEKMWLNQFVEEYYCGKIKKGDKKALHQGDRLRKDCYTRNNKINKDLYSICRTSAYFLVFQNKYLQEIFGSIEDDTKNS